MVTKDLGPVSAYALAVAHGFKGTEEEFARLQAESGQNAQAAAQSAAEAHAAAEAMIERKDVAEFARSVAFRDYVDGAYVNVSNGATASHADYAYTDYIDVSYVDEVIVQTHIITGHTKPGICLYDASRKYMRGVAIEGTAVKVDVSDAWYIRVSCDITRKAESCLVIPSAEVAYSAGRSQSIHDDRAIKVDYVYGKIDNSTGEVTGIIPRNTLITKDLWYAGVGTVRITSADYTAAFRAFEYDENRTFLRASDLTTAATYVLSPDCKYFRLTVTKTDGTAIENPDEVIAKVTVAYYGLDYGVYSGINADITGLTKIVDRHAADITALSETVDENTAALERLKYPQQGELFIHPPMEEYPFPDNLDDYPINTAGQLNAVYGLWDALVESFPDHVTMEVLGKDASGLYDIRAYTITSNSDVCIFENARHLKLLYMSTIHGNETTCVYEDYWFFKKLLESHKTGNNRVLWDNTTIKVIPICNPWGFEHMTRLNANGVNLNRNFSGNWTYIAQADDQYNYSGEAAMSEAETQIIGKFIADNKDAFYCFNRHNTETFTAAGKVGYLMSFWDSDVSVYRSMVNNLDTAIKERFAWVLGDVPANAGKAVFYVPKTSYAHRYPGSMDSHWALVHGMHGALIEVGTRVGLGDDYPNGTMADLMAIGIKVVSEAMTYPVVYNNSIIRGGKGNGG